MAAVVAGVFGLISVKDKKAAQSAAGSSNAKAADTDEKNQSLQEQLDAANGRIRTLESQLAAQPTKGSSTVPPTPSVVTSNPPNVFHQGSFKLLPRKQADLDAPFNDPQWGTVTAAGPTDVEWRPYDKATIGKPFPGNNVQFMLIGQSAPTEDTCTSITGYTSDEISLSSVSVGTYFCWLSSDGRYAVLKVTEMPKDLSSVTIAATVFKKQGD